MKLRILLGVILTSTISITDTSAQVTTVANQIKLVGNGSELTLAPPTSGSGEFTVTLPVPPLDASFLLTRSSSPQEVFGGLKLNGSSLNLTNASILINGASGGTNKVLSLDGSGNLTWGTVSGLPSASSNRTLRYDATNGWQASSLITNDDNTATINGELKIDNGHFQSAQSSAPGVSAITSSGVLSSFASILASSTDVAGKLSLTISSIDILNPVTPCPLIAVTFSQVYTQAPIVMIVATNQNAADIPIFLTSVTTSGFSVYSSASSSDVGIGTFTFNYFVIETL